MESDRMTKRIKILIKASCGHYVIINPEEHYAEGAIKIAEDLVVCNQCVKIAEKLGIKYFMEIERA